MVLKGKSALITGAASGIGRPIAQGFARAEARRGPTSVTALVEATGAGQANVSKHLALLTDAGMVGRRKEGLNVYYFVADESLFELCELVCGRLAKELAEKARRFSG